MAERKFIWLPRDSVWRGTVKLKQDQEYPFADFPEDVTAQWLECGAIKEVVKVKKTKAIEEE